MGISSYTLDSFLRAVIDSDPDFYANLTYNYLHNVVNTVYLDTTIVNFVAPGLLQYYGPLRPIDTILRVQNFDGLYSSDESPWLHLGFNLSAELSVEIE